MRSVTVRLEDLRTMIINLGFVGENEHRQIRFDCKKMFDEYPHASVSLTVAPAEGESYPAIVERDGGIVTWTITDSDLTAEGDGELQLSFTNGETVAKTYIGRCRVCRSIVPTGEIPSGIDDFITRAGALLDQVEDTFPAGGTTGQVLAKKSDTDYDTEWVDQGAGGTSDYDELENRPQIGGVTLTGNKTLHDLGAASEADVAAKYTKPETGIPASDLAAGVIPDPEDLIDDTAGSGDTDKVWSADKSHALLTEINSRYTKPNTGIPASDMAQGVQTSLGLADSAYQKPGTGIPASDLASGVIPSVPVQDVQINGTSILNAQGVANVPFADNSGVAGVAKYETWRGIAVNVNGYAYLNSVSSGLVKNGNDAYRPLVPSLQHESVFYGLAKLAGADMASSSNPVGQFTDDALVKIQKMLGIYEAPWELIREDTVTNATEADIEITVDGDGNPFELTDAVLQFETPVQETPSAKGYYGIILFYYGSGSYDYFTTESGAWTQSENGLAHGAISILENRNGMIFTGSTFQTTGGNATNYRYRYVNGFSEGCGVALKSKGLAFKKINIRAVTGKGHYKLYGRRKWN